MLSWQLRGAPPRPFHLSRCLFFAALAVVLALSNRPLLAQLPTPQLFALSPAGGRQGSAVEVKLAAGADLDGVDRLLFSHPGITAQPKLADPLVPGRQGEPIPNLFVVSVAADVPPGIYDARAAGPLGISNPRAFMVGHLPEVLEEPNNNSLEKPMRVTLESVVNGQANGGAADFFKFTARQGQRVILDVWAERIDSHMDATLLVYDPAGREIARSRDFCGRDPLVDLPIPVDGDYVVMVYDFLYQAGSEYPYRLVISTEPYVDFVFPPAGQPQTKGGHYTVYGRNLPGGKPAPGAKVYGRPLESLGVVIDVPGGDASQSLVFHGCVPARQSFLDGFEYRLTASGGASQPCFLGFASAPVVVKQGAIRDPAAAQKVNVPCEFVGQFAPRGAADWIQFEARKGQVYAIELISQRQNLTTDPYFLLQRVVKNDKGEEQVSDIVEQDDGPKDVGAPAFSLVSNDPVYRFEVPDDGTYRILVRDLYAGDDARDVYRLSIRTPAPDFRLVAVSAFPTLAKEAKPWSCIVPRGGAATMDVIAQRRDGFDGEIELSAEGLPPGVKCAGAVLGPKQDNVELVFEGAEDAPAWAGTIRVLGRAKIGDATIARQARGGVAVWAPPKTTPPSLAMGRETQEIALAIVADSLPVAVELGTGQTWQAAPGGKVEIPVKVVRRGNFKESLALTIADPPTGVKAQALTIGADKSEGKLTLEVDKKANLGTFSCNLHAQAKVSYRRGEALAKSAAETKQQIEKLATDLNASVQQAEKDCQATVQAAQAADAAAKQCRTKGRRRPGRSESGRRA